MINKFKLLPIVTKIKYIQIVVAAKKNSPHNSVEGSGYVSVDKWCTILTSTFTNPLIWVDIF